MLINYFPFRPRANKKKVDNNLVVSMTTTPSRIEKIWPTIFSVLRQSVLPSKIFLWIPKHYKRFAGTVDSIPTFLHHSLIEIRYIDNDYGPATKLLPLLEQDLPGTVNAIVIDDDRIYHSETFRELLALKSQHPSAAVTIAGIVFEGDAFAEHLNPRKDQRVDSLLGYGSFCISSNMFDENIFIYPKNNKSVFYEDDIWISGHLKKQGVPIWQPKRRYSKFSHQNLLLNNHLCRKTALCMSENRDKSNLLNAWNYFNNV